MDTLGSSNQESKFIPKPHFIAYIDILGYEEKVNNGDMKLAKNIDSILDIASDVAKEYLKEYLGKHNAKDIGIKIKAFSDNVIMCTEDNWDVLFLIVGFLQSYMIHNGYFVRGAMCHSELHFDERFIFGKGIIKAYKIESNIAKFPRIILHSSYKDAVSSLEKDKIIFDAFTSAAGMLPMYLHDDDGYKFLNYLEIVRTMQMLKAKQDFGDILKSHREQIIYSIAHCEKCSLQPAIMENFFMVLSIS